MVRSPDEEEGKDAGTGSGSWPRSRRYAVGEEVEVLLTGRGFRGARYEATVTARLPGSGGYKVVYSRLVKRRGGSPLQEVVAESDVRPRPPPPPPGRELELFDLVEAYHSDGWWPGVVSDIRPKRRRNQETKFAVSLPLFRQVVKLSASFVRPRREFVYGSWIDAQEVKYARNRNYSDSDSDCSSDSGYSPEFSTPGGNSDQYSSIPNKRMRKENAQMEDVQLRHSINLRQDTGSSSLKDVMDMEIPSENHVYGVANVEEQILEANAVKLICTPCDGKGRHSMSKALASKRKDLSLIEIGSKYSFGDVVISDDSSHESFIVISDDSSCYNPIKMQRRMKLPDEELHSNHLMHNNQAPCSASRLWQTQNPQHYLLSDASRYSKEHACRNVLSQSMEPLESSQDHSHKDGGQQIPLPGSQVQEFLGRNDAVEPRLLDHLHLDNMSVKIDDSATGGENHEIQKITEVNSWVAGTSIEGAGSGLTNPRISNQKTVNQSYGGAFPIEKLEPSSSRLQDFENSLLCIEAPNDNMIDTENKKACISPEEAAAFLIGKLEPPSSGQKGVKADLVCIEARSNNKMEIKNERMGMSLVSATCRNSKDIAIVSSYTECNASLQQPWGQPLVPVSEKSAGPSSLLHPGVMVDISAFMPLAVPNSSNLSPVFSTTCMLLMPKNKMEVFAKLLLRIP